MAKSKSSDEIIDKLAEDVGAKAPGDGKADGAKSGSGKSGGGKSGDGKSGQTDRPKPNAEAHFDTVSDLLMGGGGELGDDDAAHKIGRFVDPAVAKRGTLNLGLFVALIVIVGVTGYFLAQQSSEEVRSERRRLRIEAEEKHMSEQLLKLKKFGNIHIESVPPGAIVVQDEDPKKCMQKKPVEGVEVDMQCVTPLDIQNLDIKPTYKFTVMKPGFENFEITVAEHVWSKKPGAEDFETSWNVELVANACEYWFVYDMKAKAEKKFAGETSLADCKKHKDDAAKTGSIVTECACKPLPPGVLPSAPSSQAGGK